MKMKIDFLDRLFTKLKCRVEILEFLKNENMISDDDMQTLLHEQHQTHSTKIAMMLNDLLNAGTLQLVDYEWSLLPKELMRLTIVSDSAKKEFLYSV